MSDDELNEIEETIILLVQKNNIEQAKKIFTIYKNAIENRISQEIYGD